MGLFSRIRKNGNQDKKDSGQKQQENVDPFALYAPASGQFVLQKHILDAEFSSGALGPGCGIIPNNGKVVSPADGTVQVIFQEGHAIGLHTDSGIQVLVHMGTNSVALNGIGFKKKVREGDHVHKGDPLVEFDLSLMKDFGLDPTVILSVSNARDYEAVLIEEGKFQVEKGSKLIQVIPDSDH